MDVQYLCQMSLTFERSRSKVKVQGQNSHNENLPLAIARLWFTIASPNLAADRSDLGTKCLSTEVKIGLVEVCTLRVLFLVL